MCSSPWELHFWCVPNMTQDILLVLFASILGTQPSHLFTQVLHFCGAHGNRMYSLLSILTVLHPIIDAASHPLLYFRSLPDASVQISKIYSASCDSARFFAQTLLMHWISFFRVLISLLQNKFKHCCISSTIMRVSQPHIIFWPASSSWCGCKMSWGAGATLIWKSKLYFLQLLDWMFESCVDEVFLDYIS